MRYLSLSDVANLLAYLAPGYFAQWAYRLRFPSRAKPAGELILISAVLSVPFVPAAEKISPDSAPTSLTYACSLIVPAILVGLVAGVVRGADGVRAALSAFGIGQQPEASIWLRTLPELSPDAQVTIDLKDGSKLAGVPRSFPGLPGGGVNELYLVYPKWIEDDGSFESGGAGVIVRLDEVVTITFEEDATQTLTE